MVTTRLASKAIRGSGYELSSDLPLGDDSGGIEESDIEEERPIKKRRIAPSSDAGVASFKAKGRSKKTRVIATLFQVLPLEIVFSVFSHLHPLDLVHLSRVNKALRRVLMSESSASIWRSARLNLEPSAPECPPDQSEPQWAKLLFEMSCVLCNRPRIKLVEFPLRLRLCQPCVKTNITSYNRAITLYSHLGDIKEVLEILPYTTCWGYWRSRMGIPNKCRLYYTHAILKMVEQLEGFHCQVAARIPGAEERLKAFRHSKIAEVNEIMTSGRAIFTWADNQERVRAGSRAALIYARVQSLREKLLALGHAGKDVNQALSRVYDTAPLTDKSWEIVRSRMEAAVEKYKISRLEHERGEYLSQRRRRFFAGYQRFLEMPECKSPFPGFAPSSFEVLDMSPSMRELVEAEGYLSLMEGSLMEGMNTHLPDVLDNWRGQVRESLLSLIPGDTFPALDTDMQLGQFSEALDLAKSVFSCGQGWDYFGIGTPVFLDPSLTQHRCRTNRIASKYYTEPPKSGGLYPCLRFDASASDGVDAICKAVQLDPNATTIVTLDELDARFECTECSEPRPKIRNWRRAVTHTHPDRSGPCFQRVPSGWENITKALELGREPSHVVCRACNMRAAFYVVARHLEQVHGKSLSIDNIMMDPAHPAEPVDVVQIEERLLEIGSSETWNLSIHPEN